MIDFFEDEGMLLNMAKSGYMIINPQSTDYKTDIIIKDNILKYNSEQMYLGQLFSDTGNISHDISRNFDNKAGNITIKLQKLFCTILGKEMCVRSMCKLIFEIWW